jgi:hypothetical protein
LVWTDLRTVNVDYSVSWECHTIARLAAIPPTVTWRGDSDQRVVFLLDQFYVDTSQGRAISQLGKSFRKSALP